MILTINCDGGSRGNPGPSALGVVVKNGDKTIAAFGEYLGIGTNNQAEYQAVIAAFEWVLTHKETIPDLSRIEFFLDSQLVVMQLTGKYRLKSPLLAPKLMAIRQKEGEVGVSVMYTHVFREQNKEADLQVNRALDTQMR